MIVYEQKARAEMCGLFLYPFSILPMIQAAVTGCFFHTYLPRDGVKLGRPDGRVREKQSKPGDSAGENLAKA